VAVAQQHRLVLIYQQAVEKAHETSVDIAEVVLELDLAVILIYTVVVALDIVYTVADLGALVILAAAALEFMQNPQTQLHLKPGDHRELAAQAAHRLAIEAPLVVAEQL
jgi:hypothetical protein